MNGLTDKLIAQIEMIRAENNKNWMAILKLAFEHAPEEAAEIFQRISKCDFKINELSKKLGEM